MNNILKIIGTLMIMTSCYLNAVGLPSGTDLKIIKNRIIQNNFEQKIKKEEVNKILNKITPTGTFSNVDYKNQDKAKWQLPYHLNCLEKLSKAYRLQEFQNKSKLKKDIFPTLDFWLDNDFQNSNWWYNEIGVPTILGNILLLLDGDLTAKQRNKGINILKRGKFKFKGQNLVWLANINIIRGILENDTNNVELAFNKISEEITDDLPEAIQPDMSFF